MAAQHKGIIIALVGVVILGGLGLGAAYVYKTALEDVKSARSENTSAEETPDTTVNDGTSEVVGKLSSYNEATRTLQVMVKVSPKRVIDGDKTTNEAPASGADSAAATDEPTYESRQYTYSRTVSVTQDDKEQSVASIPRGQDVTFVVRDADNVVTHIIIP